MKNLTQAPVSVYALRSEPIAWQHLLANASDLEKLPHSASPPAAQQAQATNRSASEYSTSTVQSS
jgi:hypothetical protein